MKVLVTGAGGQVGKYLVQLFDDVVPATREQLDISNAKAVSELVVSESPDVIINAASMTDVDGCELRVDEAYAANAVGVRNLAVASNSVGAHVIHISTDYVFDGKIARPYHEWDDTNPISVYGRSKLGGEIELIHNCNRWTIARTAWVFGGRGSDFVSWAIDACDRGTLEGVVDDQVSSPTYAKDLADVLRTIAEERMFGLFHVANTGVGSRFDQADLALRTSGRDVSSLKRISSRDLARPAPRPDFSALDCMGLRISGLKPLRDWREALEEYVTLDR